MRREISRIWLSFTTAGAVRSALSIVIITSAWLRAGRLPEPAKITASMSAARSDLCEVSPMAQRKASTRLDLPQPFGPTTPVRPDSIRKSVGSTNDLKPWRRRRVSFMKADSLFGGERISQPRQYHRRQSRCGRCAGRTNSRAATMAAPYLQGNGLKAIFPRLLRDLRNTPTLWRNRLANQLFKSGLIFFSNSSIEVSPLILSPLTKNVGVESTFSTSLAYFWSAAILSSNAWSFRHCSACCWVKPACLPIRVRLSVVFFITQSFCDLNRRSVTAKYLLASPLAMQRDSIEPAAALMSSGNSRKT